MCRSHADRDAALTPSDDAVFWMLKTYMGILRSHCDDDCGLVIGNLTRDRRYASCECPLLAQSGHAQLHRTCLLLGVKRTWAHAPLDVRFRGFDHHVFLTGVVAPYLLAETVGTLCTPSQQPLRQSAGIKAQFCGRSMPERFQSLKTRTASGRSIPPNCTAFIPHYGARPRMAMSNCACINSHC